ncbi:MAG TPA: alanine--tRNA ligase-related protein [Candidatus Paceibacterota bacterium]|nr:alanine--tRNA ligase-related protein [Candidatus Paceibacterota bacterium]
MEHARIRRRFKEFMQSHDHQWVASSSLLPDDPSVLFTTAGMQQFKKYYTEPSLAPGKNVASIQKCVRTSDIDEVGDTSHLTFFEMLGNFSFGGYFKEEAITLTHEFITREMGLTIDYVSVFGGEGEVPADHDSKKIWETLDPTIEVRSSGRADNFWGPTGAEGPCGPTTEVYVDGLEIWNVVFNQYYQEKDGSLRSLEVPGIDTGMGMERLAMVAQHVPTVFDTDLFAPIMHLLPESLDERIRRIVADHARAVAFLIADGVRPSNKEQGYVLRRFLRRMIVHLSGTGIDMSAPLAKVIELYGNTYHLNGDEILHVAKAEAEKFDRTLHQGIRELAKLESIDAANAFRLYESFGLPYELIKDLGGAKADGLSRDAFDEKFKEHQEKSRAGVEKKFGGHGLIFDTGELKAANADELQKVTRLHTATHLLHAALRKVLGDAVGQAGSDITVERTRFDFTFPRKLTPEEIAAIQEVVNDAIARDLPVNKAVMAKDEAERTGALFFFKEKYPDPVNVYYTGDDMLSAFSKEFCGGPHVQHTGEIGTFRIIKEEAVGAGVRRIRAIVE